MDRHFIFKNKAAMMRVLTHSPGIYTGRNHSVGGEYKESSYYFPMLHHNVNNGPDIYHKKVAAEPEPYDPIPQFMRQGPKRKQQTGNGFDKATNEALSHPVQV